MNKTLLFSVIITGLIVFTGCIIPGVRRERSEIELPRNDSLFVIEEGDFHFRLVLPKDLMIVHEPVITLLETENKLSITCGPSFQIFACLSEHDLIKSQERNGILNYNILDNEDQCVVYSRLLPDGTIYDYGMQQQTALNGQNYYFETDLNGEFSMDDVLRMKLALASIKI